MYLYTFGKYDMLGSTKTPAKVQVFASTPLYGYAKALAALQPEEDEVLIITNTELLA